MHIRLLTFACGLLLTAIAPAEPMQVTPGKWQIQVTSRCRCCPGLLVKQMEQCFTSRQISPQRLMLQTNRCEFTDVRSSPGQLDWKMRCLGHGGEMTGSGRFQSSGESMEGRLLMSMEMNGRQIEMTHQWTGRRIGDCN